MLIQVSKNLKKLSKMFPSDLYVVGGYVRNSLLGIRVNDVDITSATTVDKVVELLNGSEFAVKIKNISTGTLLINVGNESYEYTAFRKDEYENGSHTPTSVTFTDSIREDAKRRDFSINAIYYNITKDEITDYYQGIIDVKQRLIKAIETPDIVFSSDGERLLRMVRFACELNLTIEDSTLKSAKKFVENLNDISGTRKLNELEKILNSDTKYSITTDKYLYGLKILNKLNVWTTFGLDIQKVKYKMVKKIKDKFLGLIIDIVDTVDPECLTSFLEKFLKKNLMMNNKRYDYILHILSGYYEALNKIDNKPFFFKYFDCFMEVKPLLFAKSKHIANRYTFFYNYIINHNLVINVTDLKINGNDIAKKYPQIDKKSYGRILNNLLNKVFDGKLANEKNVLLEYIEENLQKY